MHTVILSCSLDGWGAQVTVRTAGSGALADLVARAGARLLEMETLHRDVAEASRGLVEVQTKLDESTAGALAERVGRKRGHVSAFGQLDGCSPLYLASVSLRNDLKHLRHSVSTAMSRRFRYFSA